MSRREQAQAIKADKRRRSQLRAGVVARLAAAQARLDCANDRIEAAHDVLDGWDALSKGPTPTTTRLREALGSRPSQAPAGPGPSAAASTS